MNPPSKPTTDTSDWHLQEAEAVLTAQGVSINAGLNAEQVAERRSKYGTNELIEKRAKSPWQIFFDQFKETMVIVLIIAAAVSFLLSGHWTDAIVILIIVFLNAALGFFQEYRAEQAMAALKRMAAPMVKVRRKSHVERLSASLLVPGDIILLEAGDAVPADARLVEAVNLRIQEASLTGESVPIEKHAKVIIGKNIALGDRLNMVYLGTAVTFGRGTAVVCGTGMSTQLGHIADLIQTVQNEQTPLQKRMAQLGRSLAWAALAIVGLVFALGLLRQEDPINMFLTAVAMAVAAVPEGLPAVVTIALALGAQRMLRRRALIRKLPAVETLGSVTTICSDKTGTLTENRMTVTILDVLGHTQTMDALLENVTPLRKAEETGTAPKPVRSLALMVKAAALCNDAILEDPEGDEKHNVIGDPTEGALVVAAAQLGFWKPDLEKRWPRVAEAPFSSERKRMTTVHQVTLEEDDPSDAPWRDAPYVAFCKGAEDTLLSACTHVWSGEEAIPLTAELRENIERSNDQFAQDGQRVLAVAFRALSELPETINETTLETEMTFIGLVGMIDPPRPEALEAVQTCRTAGIRPMMITGDHPLTARRIAQDLGIATNDRVISGPELAEMTDEQLDAIVEEVSVFARVAPSQKLDIVQSLQRKGHIVAMTGDGVNDAPALRKSDIGVAMGITGTDVSKQAADMVLLDDNFATIVSAVEEGRTIFDNVRKFIKYTMTSNAGEIYVMLFAPFLGMPLPLTAIQILWINLVTDGLPGLALSVEPPERNIMRRPPFAPGESIFARGLGIHILWVGLVMGLISLFTGFFGFVNDLPHWQTMVFTTLTLSQMAHALAIRSDREPIWRLGLLTNKPLLGAVLLTFVLQMLVTYVPFLQDIFGTQALSFWELAASLGLSAMMLVIVEIEKWFRRRRTAA